MKRQLKNEKERQKIVKSEEKTDDSTEKKKPKKLAS